MYRDRSNYLLVGAVVVVVVMILVVVVEAVRLLFLVAFCLLLPGLGWARRASRGDAIDTVALAVLISMSSTILVATAMAVLNAWSAPGGIAVLIAFAVLGFVPFGRSAASSKAHP